MLATMNTERGQNCEISVGKEKRTFSKFYLRGLYNEGPYIFQCTDQLPLVDLVDLVPTVLYFIYH